MTYDKSRPHIHAGIKRQVMTEAGHSCSVQHCSEHIVEIHHIDLNRENNDPNNLIVLCDKHHKLAHSGQISKMDLKEYKRLLVEGPTITTVIGYGEYDKNLLNKINSIFSFDTILKIKNESFGRFVVKDVIEPFHELFYAAEDPLFKFTSPHLEQLRLDVLNKATIFFRHFAQQSALCVNLPMSNYDLR